MDKAGAAMRWVAATDDGNEVGPFPFSLSLLWLSSFVAVAQEQGRQEKMVG
jgi:hypothetical protein